MRPWTAGKPLGMTQKQETIESRQLRAISSSAEIIKENTSSEVYVQCTSCSNRSRLGKVFLQLWKEAWRIDSRTGKERSTYNWERLSKHSITRTTPNDRTCPTRPTPRHIKKIRYTWHGCATLSEDAQGEESPTQSPAKRSCMKDALIAGKKTKHSGIKCSSTDIQKKNCKAGTLEWEENSVFMQNVNHHVKQVNRYIREVWKWSKARTSPTLVKQHTERHREREQEQRIAGR